MDRSWRLWGTLFVLAGAGGRRAARLYRDAGRARPCCRDRRFHCNLPYQAVAQPVKKVAWIPATFDARYGADRANGARIVEERCVSCHTLEGNTPDPTIPRNVGQSVFAL
jgi:mono/diheme cytochrome c family protein